MGGHLHGSAGKGLRPVRIKLLGGFRISVGSSTIEERDWRLSRSAALVKLLALTPGHRLHRDQVADLLWPNLGTRAAYNGLRQALHRARRTLDPDPNIAPRYLSLRNEQLALCPEGQVWVDAETFEEAAAQARRARDPVAYRSAIELYAGDLLPEDRYEDWAEARRTELRTSHLALLVEMASLCERHGDLGAVIEALQRVVRIEPRHEEAHAGLMRAYALSGQRYLALAQYERLKKTLSQELLTEPHPASKELYREILAGRVSPIHSPAGSRSSHEVGRPGHHDLPRSLTSFVGREHESLEVKRNLAMTRLLTLMGTGGCGKTRLAVEVARDLSGAYPDGVWLVELADLSEAELVPQAVATILGVREQPDRPLSATLVEALRQRNMLVVMDNCEHLVDASARLVETLLGTCPGLRIMATSREALGVAGEVRWVVPPLSIPDPWPSTEIGELKRSEAVRLFTERARDRFPDFELTPQNARSVTEICRRVEGIPLALELAAARIGVLSVEQIAARLEDALSLLTVGDRTTESRQQTLRKTLEWSHGLLGDEEQGLFARLSVFAGGWTLDAAEVVVGGDGIEERSILDVLSQLIDKSLLTTGADASQEARYRMLEPVRQYASGCLVALGTAERLQRRHAEYFLKMAESAEPELKGQRQLMWLEQLEVEHDNLRKSLSWATEQQTEWGLRLGGALWRFWYARGHLSEGRRVLERALARSDAVATPARVKALDGAGWLMYVQGDYLQAEDMFAEQLRLSRALHDDAGVARSLGNLGALALSRGNHERATRLLEESLIVLRRLGNSEDSISVLNELGSLASARGELARAVTLHEEALALSREVGDVLGVAVSMGNSGLTKLLAGDNDGAALLEESLTLFREVGNDLDVAIALVNLAFAVLAQGDHERAMRLLEESLPLCQELGDRKAVANSLEGMAAAAGAQERPTRAARLWGAAQALRENLGAPLPPDERVMQEPYMVAVRSQLGQSSWEAAWSEGYDMSLDAAADYALPAKVDPIASRAPVTGPSDASTIVLTPREEEVAALVAQGLTNRQVATELVISEQTAATHVKKILKKLTLHSRSQLAAWVAEQSLDASNLP